MQELGIKKCIGHLQKERNSLIRADVIITTRLYVFGPEDELWSFDSYIAEQTSLLTAEIRMHLINFGCIRVENQKDVNDLSHPFWAYIGLNDAFFWQLALNSLSDLLKGWLFGLKYKPGKEDVEIWTSVIKFCQEREQWKKRAELKEMGFVMNLLFNFLRRSAQMQAVIKLIEIS